MLKKLSGLLIALAATSVSAAPITYTFELPGSTVTLGGPGGTIYTGANLLINLLGDSENTEAATFNRTFNRGLAGSFTLTATEGTFNGIFANPVNIAANHNNGFTSFSVPLDGSADALNLGAASVGYYLNTSWGPVTGLNGSVQSGRPWHDTNLGEMRFSLGTPVDATFSVTLVPEPASLALFASGLAGLGFVARRRKAAKEKLTAS